jgi:hypothetical protein
MSKATIQLTNEQRDQNLHETGDEAVGFTCEKLENRDAPKIGGGVSEFIRTGGDLKDASLLRGGGMSVVDPVS